MSMQMQHITQWNCSLMTFCIENLCLMTLLAAEMLSIMSLCVFGLDTVMECKPFHRNIFSFRYPFTLAGEGITSEIPDLQQCYSTNNKPKCDCPDPILHAFTPITSLKWVVPFKTQWTYNNAKLWLVCRIRGLIRY